MFRHFLFSLCLFFLPLNVSAGTSCDQPSMTPELIAAATDKALEVRAYLNEIKPIVGILARVGSDVSKYGMYYTHLGFVLKQPGDTEWSVIHLLNACGTATSRIYEQGLANYFLDDLLNMDAKVVIPTPALQKKLAVVLASSKIVTFHNPSYSMIAYPFSTQYQNSNQWALELLASALHDAKERKQAQDYLKATNYKPAKIAISGLSKIGAHLFKSNVSFSDHPENEGTNGKYSVVTVDSIVEYLKSQQLVSAEKEFRN
ncbi:MAG: DUF2145 domain-containing protein [Gammaproteobacteria bacterium]